MEEREAFLERIAAQIRKREQKARAEAPERRRRLLEAGLEEAHRLTRKFREEDPELGRVVLFGSLATEEIGDREPDVDLAVQSDRYLRLVAIALDSPFRVDVVDLSTARPAILEAIRREGKVLYAR